MLVNIAYSLALFAFICEKIANSKLFDPTRREILWIFGAEDAGRPTPFKDDKANKAKI